MSHRAQRAVWNALAAALILAPVGAVAQPEQRQIQEQRPRASPLKILRKAFDRFRNQGGRDAQARGAGAAEPPASSPVPPTVARLPRPRPWPQQAPAASAELPGPLADSNAAPGNSTAVRMLLGTEPGGRAPPSVGLIEMPDNFSAAGMAAASSMLPVPEEVPPRRASDALASGSPEVLGPLPNGAVGHAMPDAASANDSLSRVPRPRPVPSALASVGPEALPVADPPSLAEPSPEPEDPACLQRLRELGVTFTEQPPMGERGCLVAHPLKVTSLGSGVAITPEAVLTCRTAEALALWTRNSLVPAGQTYLEAAPIEIAQGSTYVCRARSGDDEKLSEHATANAVDIASIGFAERPRVHMEALDGATPEARFAAAVRKESCAYFTTVLGPGTNAAHATHFHFDMAQREGGYRLCDLGETSTAKRADEGPTAPQAAGQ